jgi:3-oxoacyl-[acyl-carrier protein] reductase
MDLKLENKQFLVTGGTKGFGGAIAEALIQEGAEVVVVARSQDKLDELKNRFNDKITCIQGDITQSEAIEKTLNSIDEARFTGAVINAGGPPAMQFMETSLKDWDETYQIILRWKIELTQKLVPILKKKQYGKLVYVESISTKQPVENLVLSNSVRLSVIGFVKTLSQELAGSGITMNVLAPGYHDTDALNRLFVKKSEQLNITVEEAREQMIAQTKMGLGDPKDMASLALWLLSPHSKYVTGQTISHDGAVMKGVFG